VGAAETGKPGGSEEHSRFRSMRVVLWDGAELAALYCETHEHLARAALHKLGFFNSKLGARNG